MTTKTKILISVIIILVIGILAGGVYIYSKYGIQCQDKESCEKVCKRWGYDGFVIHYGMTGTADYSCASSAEISCMDSCFGKGEGLLYNGRCSCEIN